METTAQKKEQCWELKNCGRQPGGDKVTHLGVCPAAQDASRNGLNGGRNAGRMCWTTAGTFCGGEVQGSFAAKVVACLDCEVFARVRQEEGHEFRFLMPGREFDEVSGIINALRDSVQRQEMTIRELSTPVLQVWEGVILLPLIGVVDTGRANDIMERVLRSVGELNAHHVILDLTGVDTVDTKTADHIMKVVRASQLLGARCVLTGIQPAVAQTLVEVGVELAGFKTLRNLQAGLRACLSEAQEAK